ncbi:hypothetical protein FGO68_gene16903 [Halteria grandinella]|uniref:histidine kinase n=1 Tax=Halteria grandinella TaxID=5974 RepID=A0A8J8SXL7_HALGN|nr:hypothetical protein FGO68_gene16903 [Halteria grandinella]
MILAEMLLNILVHTLLLTLRYYYEEGDPSREGNQFMIIIMINCLMFVLTTSAFFLAKKVAKLKHHFVYIMTMVFFTGATETTCRSYTDIQKMEGMDLCFVLMSTLMVVSYNQLFIYSFYLQGAVISLIRFYLRFGYSHAFVRFSITFLIANVFLCIISRQRETKERERFEVYCKQKRLIELFRTVIRANHDGIVITNGDKIIYNNEKVLKIMKIEEQYKEQNDLSPDFQLTIENIENSQRQLQETGNEISRKRNQNDLKVFDQKQVLKDALIRTSVKPGIEQMPRKLTLLQNMNQRRVSQVNCSVEQGSIPNLNCMWDHIKSKASLEQQLEELASINTQSSQMDGLYFKLDSPMPKLNNQSSGIQDLEEEEPKLQMFSQLAEIESGKVLTVTTIRDMSPWLELEKQRGLSEMKTIAFAQAAHEFRNPLNGIVSSLDLLSDTFMSENKRLYFDTALNCSHLMLSLVKDILDFSQLEAKSFILNPTLTNLSALLNQCTSIFKFKAKDKQIELLVDDSSVELYPQVIIDEGRVKQIIINLLSNAIKYTERGHVKLSAQIQDQMITIAIEDTGVGMNSSQVAQLFSNFTKFMKNRHLNRDGVGLGLSISKNLANALGGDIQVQSTCGVGSQFVLSIPFKTATENLNRSLDETEQKELNQQANIGDSLHCDSGMYVKYNSLREDIENQLDNNFIQELEQVKLTHIFETTDQDFKALDSQFRNLNDSFSLAKTLNCLNNSNQQYCQERCECAQVLIVDDESFNLIALEGLIAMIEPNIKIQKAFNGKEALQKIAQSYSIDRCGKGAIHVPIQQIITDNNMPVMTGVELAQQIKIGWGQNPILDWHKFASVNLSIVLLTGDGQGNSFCSDPPLFSRILGKPVNIQALRQAIRESVAYYDEEQPQKQLRPAQNW